MAKTSMIAREHKRTKTVEKFAAKRAAIKAVLNDANASMRISGKHRLSCRNCLVMPAQFASDEDARLQAVLMGVS